METRANLVRYRLPRLMLGVLLGLLSYVLLGSAVSRSVSAAQAVPAAESQPDPTTNAGTVLVHPKLGGQILGYDIDRNGTEGLLSEYVALGTGNSNVATETFDQKTGKILKVVIKKTNTQD